MKKGLLNQSDEFESQWMMWLELNYHSTDIQHLGIIVRLDIDPLDLIPIPAHDSFSRQYNSDTSHPH